MDNNIRTAKEQYGIKNDVWEQIISIAKQNGVKRMVLFGSRARGDYSRASDIDLALVGGNIDRCYLDLEDDAETLLTFDVIDFSADISDELRSNIKKEGVMIYETV